MPMLKIATQQMSENFGKQWTYKGVAIFQDHAAHQYAADFANMVLTSFIEDQQRKAAAAAKAKQIVLTE